MTPSYPAPLLEIAINERYGELAEGSCCLSCGGAINLAEPQPGEVCLDLGSGRGQDVLRLAEAVGSSGFAYGVDLTPAMLDTARRTAAKMGVENVKFLQAELSAIDLPSESLDLIISNCTINHAGDKLAVWQELFRLLKPGGRFVVSDIYSMDEVPEQFRNDPQAVAECWAGAVTRPVYMATLEQAGFPGVQILEESAPYPKGQIQCVSITLKGFKPRS